MGSKTPMAHGSSFVQFFIRRRISDLHIEGLPAGLSD